MSNSASTTDAAARFADCWFLTGPTASGKTAVGVELAHRLGAEIVSLDSMSVYRGMDVGTAKPTAAERKGVPHHLIDVVAPGEEFSVARYLEEAARTVEQIRGRGRQALFVGGTPLYLKAILRGIFAGPAADWTLRRRLLDEVTTCGPEPLHARLAQVDPKTAARLHANDIRRVIRALEVFELTGRPISDLQHSFDHVAEPGGRRVIVLDWPRDMLHERINRRVDAMIAAGLVEEVRRLLAAGPWSQSALQAVGYREVIEHLEGVRDLPATIERIQTRTRQFAKRQMTWFRSLSECHFVAVAEPCEVVAVADRIMTLF